MTEALIGATALMLAAGTMFGFMGLYAGAPLSPLSLALCHLARSLVWRRYR